MLKLMVRDVPICESSLMLLVKVKVLHIVCVIRINTVILFELSSFTAIHHVQGFLGQEKFSSCPPFQLCTQGGRVNHGSIMRNLGREPGPSSFL